MRRTNIHLDIYVVPGDDRLTTNSRNLDFDVHCLQAFRADVDLDKTRVDGLVELPEASDKPNRALLDVPERVGARAAWDGATRSNAGAKSLQHGTVKAMGDLIN